MQAADSRFAGPLKNGWLRECGGGLAMRSHMRLLCVTHANRIKNSFTFRFSLLRFL